MVKFSFSEKLVVEKGKKFKLATIFFTDKVTGG